MPDFYVYQYIRASASEHGPVGSPYYIGKGSGKRAYRKNLIEIKPPKDKSKIIILFDGLLDKEALAIEKQLIELHGRIDLGTGCLRNKTFGGEGNAGAIRTEEMRAWQSLIKKGKKHIPEARAKMSASRIGKKHSEETKIRMSSTATGRKRGAMSEDTKMKLSLSLKGMEKGEGFSEKLSIAQKGHIISQETRDKIAASLTGRKASQETRAKMSRTHKERRAHEKCGQ